MAFFSKSKRVKTPIVLQTHAAECGAACLGTVLAFFGCWRPLSELRVLCKVNRDGSTAGDLARAARKFGLECSGHAVEVEQLKKMPLPSVIFWEFCHFLVFEGFDSDHVFVNDPRTGRRKIPNDEFDRGFTGIVLQFAAGEKFQKSGNEDSLFDRVLPWLLASKGLLGSIGLTSLLMTLIAFVTPLALMFFVDEVIGGQLAWVTELGLGLILAAVLIYLCAYFRERCLHQLSIRSAVLLADHCVTHLLRLPVAYFANRLPGDLITRLLAIEKIMTALTKDMIPIVLDLVTAVSLFGLVVYLDLTLALTLLVHIFLFAVVVHIASQFKLDAVQAAIREDGMLDAIGMQMLDSPREFRAAMSDDRFFTRWSGHQARELAAYRKTSLLNRIDIVLQALFMTFGHAIVIFVGALQVVRGEISLGAMVAFFTVAGLMIQPIRKVIELLNGRESFKLNLQRLDDILHTQEALRGAVANDDKLQLFNDRLRLAGKVELRDVTFGYNANRPPLIESFNLTIETGQRVAIVGTSGSGKSTIAQLLAGSQKPWSGQILFDDSLVESVPEDVLARSISMVNQHIALFTATVRDNITLWNPAIRDDAVVNAARAAAIHDEILQLSQGYGTMVLKNGSNFSGGQKQRLEIARALVGNPSILILDEASSALDAATEAAVDDAIRKTGCTCLIVAHRLSTVRDCDQIVVLDQGKVVQQGVHDELIKDTEGKYYELIVSG